MFLLQQEFQTYDLIAEANGFNEFKRIFTRYRIGVKASIDDIDESALKLMALDTPVETAFAQDHHISSTEWMFNKRLIDCSEISESYLRNEIRNITENCDGEKARGLLIYAYCSEDITSEVNRLSRLYCDLNLRNYPIIILFLDDHDKEMSVLLHTDLSPFLLRAYSAYRCISRVPSDAARYEREYLRLGKAAPGDIPAGRTKSRRKAPVRPASAVFPDRR